MRQRAGCYPMRPDTRVRSRRANQDRGERSLGETAPTSEASLGCAGESRLDSGLMKKRSLRPGWLRKRASGLHPAELVQNRLAVGLPPAMQVPGLEVRKAREGSDLAFKSWRRSRSAVFERYHSGPLRKGTARLFTRRKSGAAWDGDWPAGSFCAAGVTSA